MRTLSSLVGCCETERTLMCTCMRARLCSHIHVPQPDATLPYAYMHSPILLKRPGATSKSRGAMQEVQEGEYELREGAVE